MSALLRRLALPPRDWLLLGRALLLTALVRALLRVVGYRRLRRLVLPSRTAAHPAPPSVERIAWAVAAAARRIPDATCLTQALVAESLLRRAGHDAVFHLGVARPEEADGLRAHAWVESGGCIVAGAGDLTPFARLPVPERWHR